MVVEFVFAVRFVYTYIIDSKNNKEREIHYSKASQFHIYYNKWNIYRHRYANEIHLDCLPYTSTLQVSFTIVD